MVSRAVAERLVETGERDVIVRFSSITRTDPTIRAVTFRYGVDVHHALIRIEPETNQVMQINLEENGTLSPTDMTWPDLDKAIEYFRSFGTPIAHSRWTSYKAVAK